MDILSLQNLSRYGGVDATEDRKQTTSSDRTQSFQDVFDAAKQMVNETNELTNKAEEEEIKFALGYSDNSHDLSVAQAKASVSLDYLVSVRKTVLDAYKEIMNLQF